MYTDIIRCRCKPLVNIQCLFTHNIIIVYLPPSSSAIIYILVVKLSFTVYTFNTVLIYKNI